MAGRASAGSTGFGQIEGPVSRAGAAVAWRPDAGKRIALLPLGLLVLTGGATVAQAVIWDGDIVATIVPMAVVLSLWLLWVAPLRKPLMLLVFLGLALDKPGDAAGRWVSPLAPIGGLLIANLNQSVNIPALKVSLLIVLLGGLLAIRIYRRLSSTGVEPEAAMPASPMLWALGGSLMTALWVSAWGAARGGDLQMTKIQLQVFIPLSLIAYLLSVSLRNRDYKTLAILVVAAASVKAVMAIWVRWTVPYHGTQELEYTTTHGDSMLAACAVVILMSVFFEAPTRRHARWIFLITPLLFAGMVANNRRLAWVQLGLSMVTLLAINPRSRPTRALMRAVVYGMPLILLYGAAGWSSSSPVFAPVRTVRSLGDANVDRSTFYRDTENFNLVYTFYENRLLGSGFGHPFEQAVNLDDISRDFKEWRFLPHNSILGLLAFAGVFGFCGLWLAPLVGIFLAARSYRHATLPEHRMAASVAMASVLVYTVHCWGDIGFTEPRSIFLVGAGLAVAGQLAVSTGAWPGRPPVAGGHTG